MSDHVTEAELLEELKAWANAPPEREPGVFTGPEISEVMGWGREKTLRELRKLVRAGKLKPERIPIVDIVGRHTSTNGYRVVVE